MLPKGILKEHSRLISLLVRSMDMLTVLLAGWIAFIVRFDQYDMPPAYQLVLLIALILTAILFSSFNIYASIRGEGFIRHIIRLTQAVSIMGLILAGLAFFTKSGDNFSRTWFITWMVTTITCFILIRCTLLLFLRFMRSRGLNERRVVILGAGELGLKLAGTVQEALWTGFRILTFMDDFAEHKPPVLQGIPVIKTPENLSQYFSREDVDEIWLALPLRAEARVKTIMHELRNQTITTRFVLDIFGLDLLNHSITDIAGIPMLNIRSSPMVGVNRLVKAIEDRVIAAIILLLISPLLLFIALAIKCTSSGPVFFRQQRHGWDGRIITVYKFRTMVLHAENENWITQATPDDKRVTRLGRFLRRTSLDELPQFFNVLQGRMSIVGPRPHAVAHNEYYKNSINTYMQRHRVKPGITGWAQINGWRGETDTLDKMQKRVEYDLYYINNWSLGFDLKIIMLTVLRGFVSRNAY